MIIDYQKAEVKKLSKRYPRLGVAVLELWERNSIAAGNRGELQCLIDDPFANTSNGGFNWYDFGLKRGGWDDLLLYRQAPSTVVTEELIRYLDFEEFS